MPEDKKESKKLDGDKGNTFFGRLFSRPQQDETYVSDLKAQWAELDKPGRLKFIIGALVGLALFIGTLLLAYRVLSFLVGNI